MCNYLDIREKKHRREYLKGLFFPLEKLKYFEQPEGKRKNRWKDWSGQEQWKEHLSHELQ